MNGNDVNNSIRDGRSKLNKLMEEKQKKEDEWKVMNAVLEVNGVGLTESLVDNEGYPRSDIDVYKVRHARHTIICLKNDLKQLMKQIEDCIHETHEAATLQGLVENTEKIVQNVTYKNPIARVDNVNQDSPAFHGGLKLGDLIMEFGSAQSLKGISSVVSHSINQPVKVVVKRADRFVTLRLTPRKWSGTGMLGCHLVDI